MTPYMVYILDTDIGNGVLPVLCEDLSRFGVRYLKPIGSFEELCEGAYEDPCPSYLICSAEEAHRSLIPRLEGQRGLYLEGVLLFCGPHEACYARWAQNHPSVVFLSHNLKEVRRAVCWLLCGGTFSATGDAIPAPRMLEAQTALRRERPPPGMGAFPKMFGSVNQPARRIISPASNVGTIGEVRPKPAPDPLRAALAAELVKFAPTYDAPRSISGYVEAHEPLPPRCRSEPDDVGKVDTRVQQANKPENGNSQKTHLHRASTETTASLNSNDAVCPDDRLADIAQLLSLLEALGVPQLEV